MKVFKIYPKIVKKNLTSIVGYIIAFIAITLIFIGSSTPQQTDGFVQRRVPVAFFNDDSDTEVIIGLKEHLSKYVIYKDVDKDMIADALYFRDIYTVVTIPEGFTQGFLNGEDVEIIKQSNPDAEINNISLDRAVNKFLSLLYVYHTTLEYDDISTIIGYVNADLQQETEVDLIIEQNVNLSIASILYNFFSYLILALVITIIGTIMLRFKNIELQRRMTVSPYSHNKSNLELLLGHFLFTIILVTILVGLSFLVYRDAMTTTNGLLFIVNTFSFALAALCIGYAFGLLVKNEEGLAAVANITSLGTSFITGAFVPQMFLGDGLLTFARLFPNYYFVANNDSIALLNDFRWESISSIVINIIIQLGFAVLFIVLALLISKKQRTNEN